MVDRSYQAANMCCQVASKRSQELPLWVQRQEGIRSKAFAPPALRSGLARKYVVDPVECKSWVACCKYTPLQAWSSS